MLCSCTPGGAVSSSWRADVSMSHGAGAQHANADAGGHTGRPHSPSADDVEGGAGSAKASKRRRRAWTESEKIRHRQACKSKGESMHAPLRAVGRADCVLPLHHPRVVTREYATGCLLSCSSLDVIRMVALCPSRDAYVPVTKCLLACARGAPPCSNAMDCREADAGAEAGNRQ